MSIVEIYLLGLVVAHVAWFYFFVTGRLLWRSVPDGPESVSLPALVITSVTGMALSGFGLLFLGFVHLLNGFGLVSALLLEGVLFWLVRRDNWFSPTFWRLTFQRFIKPWTIPAVFIYVLFLALGVPAILPPIGGDPVGYHLAYAVDWANAGRIYVDPFLRFPYYANNFLLFDSALFILKLGNYCHFLTWLCGLLTCLGVLAFFTPAQFNPAERPSGGSHFQPQQFLIPLSIALSPVFLRFVNLSYADVPIGLFLLVPVLCVYSTSPRRPFERELVVIAAFCVGMKLTLIGHLPFFIVSLFLASAGRLSRRAMVLLVFLLLGLSLPCSVRNVIETRDPAPPIFNLYFKHPDPIYTQADAKIYSSRLQSDLKKPLRLLLLPFRFFAYPSAHPFYEFGVSAMILLVYAPLFFLLAQFFWPNKRGPPERLIYLSIAVAYLAFPWFFCAESRHALHWYPVLAAWVGVIVSRFYMRAETPEGSRMARWTTRIITAAFCCACIIPTPTPRSLWFYQHYYESTFDLLQLGGNPGRYLEKNLPGYLASEAVIETLTSEHKKQTHVLALWTESLHFYFRKNANIISVGDHFGPARYRDLIREIKHTEGRLPYLTRLDISAVITRPELGGDWPRVYSKLRARLRNYGYNEYRCREDIVAIFLRNDIKPSGRLEPVL